MRAVILGGVAIIVTVAAILGQVALSNTEDPHDPNQVISIELQHESQPSKIVRFARGYLARGFRTGRGLEDGPFVTGQVTIAFTHPGMDIPAPDDPSVGDCSDRGPCIYYASLQVSKPGVTERFYRSTVGGDDLYSDPALLAPDDGDPPGIDKVFAASWRLSYYSPPGRDLNSAVLINCERATEENLARCRIFFETEKGIAVVMGGVMRRDLTDWRAVLTDVVAFVDQAVI